MKITIAHLYPDLLNLYGDTGNILTLQRRMEKRGIEAEVKKYGINDHIDFENTDIIYIGAGPQRDTKLVCETLRQYKKELMDYAQSGGCILAVCGGFQMLGNYYETEDETVTGLEILDIHTQYSKDRIMGDIIIKSDMISSTVVGFENHYGKTDIKDLEPLGEVIYGNGNNGDDKKEGAIYKNIIGTHMHGPLLPKNPALADEIIKRAVKFRYGEDISLEPIDDSMEEKAHNYMLDRLLK